MNEVELLSSRDRRVRLQELVHTVWDSVFEGLCPPVRAFGSQEYGLATDSSDWDYALEIDEHLMVHAKVFRAKFRQHLCDSGLAVWSKTEDQSKLNTLKWKFKGDAVQSSLNVSSSEEMSLARATTLFLKKFYTEHKGLKELVKSVASLLRGAGHMVVAGTVGQTLKSAALFLWCAYFIDSGSKLDTPEEMLLCLGTFAAENWAIEVDLDNCKMDCVKREARWRKMH